MPPVKTDTNVLRLQRPVLAVADVVFSCPGYFDRSALNGPGQKDRIEGEVSFVFAPEAAAQP